MLAYKSIEPHLKNLRYIGYYQIEQNDTKSRRYLHNIYMKIILFQIILFTVQQVMKIYEVMGDFNKVMDTLFLMLTHSDSLYKQVVLWKKQDQIEEILDILKSPLFGQNDPEHNTILTRMSRQALIVLRVFNGAALVTCALWVLYPIIQYIQNEPVDFVIQLPFDANKTPNLYYALIYVWINTSWVAIGNTTMDAFISFFLAQCKTQLVILRLNLETVVANTEIKAKDTSQSFIELYHKQFKDILLHYDLIVSLCNKTQDIFGDVLFYQFLISGWIICVSVYRMTDTNMTFVALSSMILYLSCILVEIYLYCHFGNEVAYESEQLLLSAFALDWNKLPLGYRRSLIIFMERVKRPLKPTAGLIIPLSNTTFVSVIRSSYTFYAFLKNTK